LSEALKNTHVPPSDELNDLLAKKQEELTKKIQKSNETD
jgi:hypothetical protein